VSEHVIDTVGTEDVRKRYGVEELVGGGRGERYIGRKGGGKDEQRPSALAGRSAIVSASGSPAEEAGSG
jgi:hypothetical protein